MKYILNMLRQLKEKGALYIIAGSFATKFVTLFGSIFVVRLLTKQEYGLLGYMENLYAFVWLIAGLGLANATMRYVVLGGTVEEKKGIYKYILKTSFIYNIAFVVAFSIIDIFYKHPYEFEIAKYLMPLMLVSLPFQYCIENNLFTERAMFQNYRYAILSFISAVAIVLGKIVGACIEGILGVVIVTVIVNILYCFFTSHSVNKKYFKYKTEHKIDKIQKNIINKYAIQYMVTNGLWTLFMAMDIFLLGKLGASAVEIADYKIAYVWPANIGILGSCIAIFVTPYFIKNENNKTWVKKNFIKTYTINLGITIFIAILVWIFAKPLILIYAGEKYLNTIELMRIILIGAVINNGMRMITANTLAAMGKVIYNMVVSIAGIIIQIALNLYLIPQYGIYGVAYTSIIVYSFMAITLLLIFYIKYCKREVGIKD